MIGELETEIEREKLRRGSRRLALAVASIVGLCGVRVKFARPKKAGAHNKGVYRIDGVEGDLEGVGAVRDALHDLGVDVHATTISNRLSHGDECDIGGRTVRRVGVATRKYGKEPAAGGVF